MYVPSEERLVLNRGMGTHKGKVFVNKARSGQGVENTHKGLSTLAEAALEKANDKDTMYLIGKGQTSITEVLEGMIEGDILAFQYHGEKYERPDWKINLGFITDVDAKNKGYEAKRKGKKKAKPAAKKSAKQELFS